jgi:cytochrome P450
LKTNTHSHTVKRIGKWGIIKLLMPLLTNPLPSLLKLARKKGRVLLFDAGKYHRMYYVADYSLTKFLLVDQKEWVHRPPVIKPLEPLLGNGIFISMKPEWLKQHNLLKPAFYEAQLKAYFGGVRIQTKIFTSKLIENAKVDTQELSQKLMLNILIKTQFASTLNLDTSKLRAAHTAIIHATSIQAEKLSAFSKAVGRAFGYRRTQLKWQKDLEVVHQFADEIYVHVAQHPEQGGFIMQAMVASKSSQAEIRDMITNLIFAGYDTTASALSWLLYNLASNPQLQEDIYQEVYSEKAFQYADITGFLKTKAIVEESLRLHPPVWAMLRKSTKAMEWKGYSFPKDSYFLIDVFGLHHDERIWKTPEKFLGDRFLAENKKGKTFSYMPFGYGSRMCIGKPMALTELIIVISEVVRSCTLKTASYIKPIIVAGTITKSKNGLPIDYEPRTNKSV